MVRRRDTVRKLVPLPQSLRPLSGWGDAEYGFHTFDEVGQRFDGLVESYIKEEGLNRFDAKLKADNHINDKSREHIRPATIMRPMSEPREY